jgi:hypothetical protein
VLAGIAQASATTDHDPLTVTDVQVDVHELATTLGLAEHPFLGLLPGLKAEPGSMAGAQPAGSVTQWTHRPGSFIRRFRGRDRCAGLPRPRAGVAGACGSDARADDALTPEGSPQRSITSASPGKTGSACRSSDCPNAERITRLAFDAHTDAEFDSRLSALREILKGLDVGGRAGGAGQIPAFLREELESNP